jgi:ubiquitin-conjugating enzyme E2 S
VCPDYASYSPSLQAAANENLSPKVMKELARELKSLDEAPPEGIRVIVNEENLANIHAEIDGPAGTPYDGGLFRMKLVLSQDFPESPPRGYFLTRIFHPNIAKNGEICVNTLKKDWKPTLGLKHVLLVVRCLLIEPYPESALNEDAGKMLLENYESYAKHAQLMTTIHALKPKPLTRVSIADVSPPEGPAQQPQQTPLSSQQGTHTPLTVNSANTDVNDAPAAAVMVDDGTGSNSGASPSAKKAKGDALVATKSLDKKKLDIRKRSLKRL